MLNHISCPINDQIILDSSFSDLQQCKEVQKMPTKNAIKSYKKLIFCDEIDRDAWLIAKPP